MLTLQMNILFIIFLIWKHYFYIMSKNLKELVLHQIYDVITNKKYEEISTFGEMIGLEKLRVLIELLQTLDGTGIVEQSEENLHTSAGTEFKPNAVKSYAPLITTLKDSNPCASCPNYKQAKATGTQLICNCTLGLPNILA